MRPETADCAAGVLVERTTVARGLPQTITDPVVLARIAAMFGDGIPRPASTPPRAPARPEAA